MNAVHQSRRLAISRAIHAYAWALALTFVFATGLVWIVGACRAGGRASLVDLEARSFALSASGLIAGAGAEASVVALVAFVAAARYSSIACLRLARSRATPLGTAATVSGLVGLSAAAGALIQLLRVPGVGSLESFLHAFKGTDLKTLLLALATIGLAPAFAEEVFFRGFLQSQLASSWGRAPTILATAMAFGIFHLNVAQGVAAFLSGLLLGWAADRFESVRPCIAAHATNNVLFAAVAAACPGWASSAQVQPWILVCGSVVFTLSVAALASRAALRSRDASLASIIQEPT